MSEENRDVLDLDEKRFERFLAEMCPLLESFFSVLKQKRFTLEELWRNLRGNLLAGFVAQGPGEAWKKRAERVVAELVVKVGGSVKIGDILLNSAERKIIQEMLKAFREQIIDPNAEEFNEFFYKKDEKGNSVFSRMGEEFTIAKDNLPRQRLVPLSKLPSNSDLVVKVSGLFCGSKGRDFAARLQETLAGLQNYLRETGFEEEGVIKISRVFREGMRLFLQGKVASESPDALTKITPLFPGNSGGDE
ncbi:MAG: hypothetical protein WC862_03790 [Patescibacteria group bacterium]